MPYIKGEDQRFDLTPICPIAQTPGELNYQITMLVCQYLQAKPIDYTRLNETLGALQAAQLEFYRRMVVPYEDLQRSSNGDVYLSSLR